jgi:hypothetical protein
VIHDQKLKARWAQVVNLLSDKFSDGEPMDLDGIIYLVGLQELGRWDKSFKKDEKVQLMHIAICRLLEPYGYYRFDYVDDDGWPHYELIIPLPVLKAGEQSLLMKEAIVGYFLDKKLID